VPDSKNAAGWTMTGPMDMLTAVLAVRLGIYLQRQTKWGVSTIYGGEWVLAVRKTIATAKAMRSISMAR
jgi:hypothetical protein